MKDQLLLIVEKYEETEKKMMDPTFIANNKAFVAASKEQSANKEVYDKSKEYLAACDSIDDANILLEDDDKDIQEMARLEIEENKAIIENLTDELKILLIPRDPNDLKNVIVEIRGAAGGDEAKIFAGDLQRMYEAYAKTKGWKVEQLERSEAESGGVNLVSFSISGDAVFSKLKFETGAHRVQRIPITETSGRIHTSTATVLVMPEIDDVAEVEVNPNDIRIDVFRSGGAGGQSVNTTDSAVRITHMPTGIIVTCQDERSQHANKDKAMKVLATKLNDLEMEKARSAETSIRKTVGTGDRSERIRTYNYPQNRVTDHRVGLTINKLDRIVLGDLDEILDTLALEEQKSKLESINEPNN